MYPMIEVMVSSTIKDLLADRDAICKAFETVPFVKIVGAEPIRDSSYTRSPYVATTEMAEKCDLFILLLGGRYGYGIGNRKSATEIEFDTAYKSDPTKILVFQKEEVEVEQKQKKFIKKVTDYYKGYWVTKYKFTHDLQPLVLDSFGIWIKERASIGYKLNYFDHFLRFAIQKSPFPISQVFYSLNEDYIELKYKIMDKFYVVHFEKSQVYKDFWGCIAILEKYFEKWRKDSYGASS